jgi:hypothetical protein
MKRTHKLLAATLRPAPLLFPVILWIASCTCAAVDCAGDVFLSVRFLSAQDSLELMDTGALNYDSLIVRRITPTGTSVWNHRLLDYPNTAFDCTIETGTDVTGYSFQFGQASPDTLLLFLQKLPDERCCPGVYELDYALRGNDTIFSNKDWELLIYR